MQKFIITILIFILPLIFCNSSEAAARRLLTGGWTKITNVTDPTVVEIGKFAVDQHNKDEKASLKFSKVVAGESQVVAGMNYNLTIAAADGGEEHNYEAGVHAVKVNVLMHLIGKGVVPMA
ncbi:hypothetical protein OSB04_012734 [Centaurea solstitialis]|uniref:Cystatin domain-containing protein n=1 Tax=Centaurea solstitialis TaxID=347529 RepID=A0AA38TBW8_9ASTR|nr:hypothetical protein OSB04_012734 [Centaurea solstitialis]